MPNPLWRMVCPWPLERVFGGGYNLLTTTIAQQIAWQMFRRFINRWRRDTLDLPPAPFWGHFAEMRARRIPTLYGISPHAFPKPSDWGDHLHLCGYWFLHAAEGWQPPADLVGFLDGGPPPVVISFGSMVDAEAENLTALVLDALRMAGQRGLLVSAWGGLGAADLPDTVFTIEHVPFDWLLPRCAAVVHHGGSGTTGIGLWAGIPSLVVPFGADQYFWGGLVRDRGAGPAPIPRQQLTADKLAYAIRTMVTHDPMRQRAAALGEKIRSEDGVAEAVRLVDRTLKS